MSTMRLVGLVGCERCYGRSVGEILIGGVGAAHIDGFHAAVARCVAESGVVGVETGIVETYGNTLAGVGMA